MARGEGLGGGNNLTPDATASDGAVESSALPPQGNDDRSAQGFVERRADRARLVDASAELEGDATQQQAVLRVRAGVIDRLVNEAGELAIARSRIEGEMRGLKDSLLDLTENVIRLRRQLREISYNFV